MFLISMGFFPRTCRRLLGVWCGWSTEAINFHGSIVSTPLLSLVCVDGLVVGALTYRSGRLWCRSQCWVGGLHCKWGGGYSPVKLGAKQGNNPGLNHSVRLDA